MTFPNICFSLEKMCLLSALFAVILICGVTSADTHWTYGKGFYMEKDSTTGETRCVPCGTCTYMPLENHEQPECWWCDSDPRPCEWKQINKPCTPTSNTEIGCLRKEGYESYRVPDRPQGFGFVCKPCTICEDGEVETSPCSEFADRKCEPLTSSKDAEDSDDDKAGDWPTPATCGAGHRLVEDPSTGEESCVMCEKGTYMHLENHRLTTCFYCKPHPALCTSKRVKKACTLKSNTKIGCAEGYFKRFANRMANAFRCVKCKVCQDGYVETVPCSENNDRVCQKLK